MGKLLPKMIQKLRLIEDLRNEIANLKQIKTTEANKAIFFHRINQERKLVRLELTLK